MKYALALCAALLTSCTTEKPAEPLLKSEYIAAEVLTSPAQPSKLTGNRTLAVFHSRRAFAGAPPIIPHELVGGSCLGCHKDGGYTPQFKAYTPVTPHPQYENCQQCHVEQSKANLLTATTFTKPAPVEIDNQALPGAPPPIPHSLQMRENCNACHAGPAAVKEIRTPHPERQNCRQCHVEVTYE
jgi:cytochrome c-type protein NapB